MLQSAFPDSEIAKGIKLKRSKCTKVVTNVIGACHREEMAQILKTEKFSVLTDETTDIASCKTAAVAVRFYHPKEGRVVTRFWDLANVYDPTNPDAVALGATGAHMFDMLRKSVFEQLPPENVIGFGSDGASVMMGKNNSVASRMQDMFPGCKIMKCICHSLHLVVSDACKTLPRSVEDLARNIFSFFSCSDKRQSELVEFQKFYHVDVHKMLQPCQTRWLSLNAVVDRIIEQWEPLRSYFTHKWLAERTMAAEQIFNGLRDPFSRLYFTFLKWVLPKVTKMNELFQSEKVVITDLLARMETCFRDFLNCYLKPEYVNKTALNSICPSDSRNFQVLDNMYLGVGVLEALKSPEVLARPDLIKEFRTRCRTFFVEACKGIQNRFDFDDNFLRAIPALKPKMALSKVARESTPSLAPLARAVPRATPPDLQLLDDEWRLLPFDSDIPDDIVKEQDVDVFWHKVGKISYESAGDPKYAVLAKFALAALSTPHSNTECERIFSKINRIKTKARNKLITDTIRGTVLASQCVRLGSKECCTTFQPTKAMVALISDSAALYRSMSSEPNKDSDVHVEDFYFDLC